MVVAAVVVVAVERAVVMEVTVEGDEVEETTPATDTDEVVVLAAAVVVVVFVVDEAGEDECGEAAFFEVAVVAGFKVVFEAVDASEDGVSLVPSVELVTIEAFLP